MEFLQHPSSSLGDLDSSVGKIGAIVSGHFPLSREFLLNWAVLKNNTAQFRNKKKVLLQQSLLQHHHKHVSELSICDGAGKLVVGQETLTPALKM
jgi:hypothetical protein